MSNRRAIPLAQRLSLEEAAASLSEPALCRRAKFYFFLPETWREDRRKKWDGRMAEKAEKGETPYAWRYVCKQFRC